MQSKADEEKGVGFNCELCIANELMGNKSGRICLIHQIDFDNDILEYNSYIKSGNVSGVIRSGNEFDYAVDRILSLHGTDRIESALRQIRYKNLTGVCIKSFPRTHLTNALLSLLMLCMGGYSGTELIHLPCTGTILDQPNIFIEAYNIWVNEYNSKVHQDRKDSKDKK